MSAGGESTNDRQNISDEVTVIKIVILMGDPNRHINQKDHFNGGI